MTTRSLLILNFGLQFLACVVFFGFSDPVKTTNWLVAGIVGVIAGVCGIGYAGLRNWDRASRISFVLGSLGVIIGWGSWVIIAPMSKANEPVINITMFAATMGWWMQILLAMQRPARGVDKPAQP